MRKKTVILTKNLPAIKKVSKSNQNSPRGLVSPLSHYSLLSSLTVKKVDEIKKPVCIDITHSTSLAKIETEVDPSKQVSDEEEKKEVPEFMQDTFCSSLKKNEPEFKREFRFKKKGADQELMSNLQTIQDQQRYIDTLLSENNDLKVKLKSLEDSSNKIIQNWHLSESSLKSYQNLLKSSDSKIKELHSLMAYKESEILEIKDMLKINETKRRVANEQMSEVETKVTLLQRQISKLNSQIFVYEQGLSNHEKVLSEKDNLIIDLNKQIDCIQHLLECEKDKQFSESVEFDKAKSSFISQIEEQKVKVEKLENENARLQENLSQLQGDIKKTTVVPQRKSEPNYDTKFISEIAKEEASRWHSRYFALGEELTSLKEQLEKLRKNEAYYKEQINSKNNLISHLETLIRDKEKSLSETESEDCGSVTVKNAEFMVKELLGALSYVAENFNCCNCFKLLQKAFVCVPCAHIICGNCVKNNQVICGACAEKVNMVLHIGVIDKISGCFYRQTNDLEKLLVILNG